MVLLVVAALLLELARHQRGQAGKWRPVLWLRRLRSGGGFPAPMGGGEDAFPAGPAEAEAKRTGQSTSWLPGRPEPEQLLVIHVVSGEEPFNGSRLLVSLLGERLRFGRFNLFHRHQNEDGSGPVQFSLAHAGQSAGFDFNQLEESSIEAVTLFLSLTEMENPMKSFVLMLETARNLAASLPGQLLDQSRQPLDERRIEADRQRILRLERQRRPVSARGRTGRRRTLKS